MAVTPEQLGLLLRYQRCREEAGAATQEKLSMQIQERKLLEPERKDCGVFSFPRSLRAAAASSHFLIRGHLVAGGTGLVEQVHRTLEA